MKSWVVQPFASNDTYICPDCGAEVRVGARQCPGCGPFQPTSKTEGEDFDPFADSSEWQEEQPAVRLDCMLRIPRNAAQEVEGKTKKARFAKWWMTILIALTLLAAVAAAVKIFQL